jgi:hypothetical protein
MGQHITKVKNKTTGHRKRLPWITQHGDSLNNEGGESNLQVRVIEHEQYADRLQNPKRITQRDMISINYKICKRFFYNHMKPGMTKKEEKKDLITS